MREQQWNDEYRLTTVCVDSYEDGQIVGRFYNPYLDEGIHFKSLTHFLIQTENLLDKMNLPQSFTTVRTFSSLPKDKQHKSTSSAGKINKGTVITFAIRVIFRQHSSWQGSIVWLEEGKEESFRSVLELILLMDSALNATISSKPRSLE